MKDRLNPNNLPVWHFVDDQGTFELANPQRISYLYFPLVNEHGMMSSVTPTLNGDAKRDQNTFLLLPVSVEDLHNTRSGRNFWVQINGEPWSVTGNSAAQISKKSSSHDQNVRLKAGSLWHSIARKHHTGLTAEVLNFVPSEGDSVELMRVTLTNTGTETLSLSPTAAIPIYGRSGDNLRDHRHVTALLHRTLCHSSGVIVKPTMSFDERGHEENEIAYAVLGVDENGLPPVGFTPLVEDFIGEGGCFTWPGVIVKDSERVYATAGSKFQGYESIGGLHFAPIQLEPGESQRYILILSILNEDRAVDDLIAKYGSNEKFEEHLRSTKKFWQEYLANLSFDHGEKRKNGWLQWVTLQPKLRQIMGNSFLPYHDYGRGGRGWRDLWQDLLAILITAQTPIDHLLVSNFAGVRFDGSNATIVGASPGDFKSDRNDIPRVWMDHGAWPLLTTKLYIDWTGNLNLLLENQTYFMDHLTHRCQQVNPDWTPSDGTKLKTQSGEVVKGSILEHLLVQHLTQFFNVGEHNMIRLEGGDWNDGLDMASERGESVAFSAMYAGNLRELSHLCRALVDSGVGEAPIAVELSLLLDHLFEPVDYDSITAKRHRLADFYDCIHKGPSGKKALLSLNKISEDLKIKADWLTTQIRKQEWVVDSTGHGWFNGYYDNHGKRVEGEHPSGVRMTLTGQVFPLMAGVATTSQAENIIQSAEAYLSAESLRGFRLNTDFGDDPPELGRAFNFAYGHKENGAVFSHMAVMFAYGLYRQGFAEAAWHVLDGLYEMSQDVNVSKMYPGIPEYFDPRGRGMYPYLTGSAAWYIFTLLTESFGVKGKIGDLSLEPKFSREQFAHAQKLRLKTVFAGKTIHLTYHNPKGLGYGDYSFSRVVINQKERDLTTSSAVFRIPRKEVESWPETVEILIELDD